MFVSSYLCVCSVCLHLFLKGGLIHLSIGEVEGSRGTKDENPWNLYHLESINQLINSTNKNLHFNK